MVRVGSQVHYQQMQPYLLRSFWHHDLTPTLTSLAYFHLQWNGLHYFPFSGGTCRFVPLSMYLRACDSFSPLLGHESQSSNHADHSHASYLCRHVHSHLQSRRFLIHPQFLFYYLHMSLVVDFHSKVQKVSLSSGMR